MNSDRPLRLESGFYEFSDSLRFIHDEALYRMVAPDALLFSILARVSASIPPSWVLPAFVGNSTPPSLCVAVVGKAGTGKSAANNTARELLNISNPEYRFDFSLGTGQGLIEAYLRPTKKHEEGYEDGMEDEKEDMDDEEIDLEDMSEDDLKGFIEDVIKDMVADGEIEPGDEFVEDEVEVEDSIEIEDVEDVDVDVEIDEAKKEEMDESEKVDEAKDEIDEASRVKGEKGVGNEDGDRDDSKIEKETEKMRFKEAMDEIQALKVELNEVNLLNAKLLYTNKIFKAKNLTEGKKVKVLKAFDKAKDVAQAKTIFETLSEGLLDKSPINESIKRGSASKASGLEPKAAKQPIIESNDVYNRMRKLAGLI